MLPGIMLSSFHFLRPWCFLALIPLAWLLYRFSLPKGKSGWEKVCDPHLLPHLLVQIHAPQQRWPLVLMAAGWLIAVVALAGPTWQRMPQPLYSSKETRVILFDLSRSMNATDLKPSRLILARFKLLDILKQYQGGFVALIVFAGEAHTVVPLTEDSKTIELHVPQLNPDIMPLQGSMPSKALQKAEELFTQSNMPPGEILLITDGVDEETPSLVNALHLKGYRISLLAVGTSEGSPIPSPEGGFLKETSGNIVMASLDLERLRQVASLGGGHFATLDPATGEDIKAVLQSQTTNPDAWKKQKDRQITQDEWREEGPWLILLLLPLAALAFRRGWLTVIAFFALTSLFNVPMAKADWKTLWKKPPNQQGQEALQAGHPEKAAQLFTDTQWQATAHYRAGHYEKAAKVWSHFQDANSQYNLGNALAHQGKWQEALNAYDQALAVNPNLSEAQFNRQLVEQQLKQSHSPQDSMPSTQNSQDSSKQNHETSSSPQQSIGSSDAQPSGSSQDKQTGHEQNQATASPSGMSDPANQKATPPPAPNRSEEETKAQKEHNELQSPSQETVKPETATQQATSQERSDKEQTDHTSSTALAQKKDTPNQNDDPETAQLNAWLQRVPDDPSGLLRRKFLSESLRYQLRDQHAPRQQATEQGW